MAAVTTNSPSLYQVIVGVGSPSALQPKVTGSFLATAVSSGCSMIFGAEDDAKQPEKQGRNIFRGCTIYRSLM